MNLLMNPVGSNAEGKLNCINAVVIMQKTYTPNFLTHKSMANNRTVRQYYVENSHPAIVDKETWKLVQNKIAAEHKRKTGA